MLGQDDTNRLAGGGNRKTYLRSVSWTDRSPNKPNPRPQQNNKARSCLPPLQPLSISRRPVEGWPKAGSDDLGVWPNPQTPRGSVQPLENSDLEQPVREFQFKKDKLAFFDKECSRIADHVYLGSDAVAKNREVLRQNGITHVLNCVGFVCPEYFKNDLVYKTLWLQDSPSEDITSILYDVFDYFEDVREQDGRVLVHCCQGVSRSTSLVIAYLMWREGQSFEDAFQYVKAARGVTNPNMGFACQLLQCQKRVHALPASPSSVLRMYRIAPHSSYDPLHLVPKMLSQPGVQALDSRGAFVVHVPRNIYVWVGKNCNSFMSNHAKVAANQVIRYERAQGPVVSIEEGEETSDFWDALTSGHVSGDGCNKVEVRTEQPLSFGNDNIASAICKVAGERKVDEYDNDFEIFHKALAGGVVPPVSVSKVGSETSLPAREIGWGRLRQKFANGAVKELITSTKMNSGSFDSHDGFDMIIANCKEELASVDCSLSGDMSEDPCGSPDSFECFPNRSPDKLTRTSNEDGHSVTLTDSSIPSPAPCDSPGSFSCLPYNRPKFTNKSPTLSPSTSEYSSSSFTFSPSSSNWSDLSYLSSRQPSPSGLESTDPGFVKAASLADELYSPYKEAPQSPRNVLSSNHNSRAATVFQSIAERRGSNPPPRMLLPSIDEPAKAPRNLVRSWSFSLPDLDGDVTRDIDAEMCDSGSDREEEMLDTNVSTSGYDAQRDREECSNSHTPLGHKTGEYAGLGLPVLYQWPTMNKVEMTSARLLDSRSVYILLASDLALPSNKNGVVYVWLGQESSCEEGQSSPINSRGSCKGCRFHCEVITQNILNQFGFPANTPLQIVKEGEEHEHFRNVLNSFSHQKVE